MARENVYPRQLNQRHIEMFHVDPRDPALAINALTVSPGRVLFSADSKYTMELLSEHGIEVLPVDISEIQKLGGGIHCCTLPLIRDSLPV
jgi:N-dimethylarginine dimethylaminohydrolase